MSGRKIALTALSLKTNLPLIDISKLEEWIEQNTKADWGFINDKRSGIFLSEADATAFKLKWM